MTILHGVKRGPHNNYKMSANVNVNAPVHVVVELQLNHRLSLINVKETKKNKTMKKQTFQIPQKKAVTMR